MFLEKPLEGPGVGLGDCSKDELIEYLSARSEVLEAEIKRLNKLIKKLS